MVVVRRDGGFTHDLGRIEFHERRRRVLLKLRSSVDVLAVLDCVYTGQALHRRPTAVLHTTAVRVRLLAKLVLIREHLVHHNFILLRRGRIQILSRLQLLALFAD